MNAFRDFSWAPEIMKGVFYASYLPSQDITFGSGKIFSIKNMVNFFFQINNMNFETYVKITKNLYRKNEKQTLIVTKFDAIRLLKKWKWKPKIYGKKLVSHLNNA